MDKLFVSKIGPMGQYVRYWKFEVFPCSSLREIGVIEKVERMNW